MAEFTGDEFEARREFEEVVRVLILITAGFEGLVSALSRTSISLIAYSYEPRATQPTSNSLELETTTDSAPLVPPSAILPFGPKTRQRTSEGSDQLILAQYKVTVDVPFIRDGFAMKASTGAGRTPI